ncbi:DUF3182 family protein [Belnapia sp. T6]|uniref:DUF3182 family protein n=1 Tax=Belnapia mucosa TaxID=2804532 RepID=A0ABS1V6V2_9PROT|nr:DUF3182 family protein [Belnapia mucosa]MBL6457410.1 DUF3182 family protein [Belnapia mucosa]
MGDFQVQRGIVAVYSDPGRGFAHSHERATREGIARQLAVLKGFEFVGEYDPGTRYPGPVYLVPSDTLVGLEVALALGVRDEHDLFGGVVSHAFVATKAITHPLVDPDAAAPPGWSPAFGHRVRGAVLSGFTAFARADARRAGEHLLERGPVRVKPVRATGGRGQVVVSDMAELEVLLSGMEAATFSEDGLVLEENLATVTTYSVGQVRVAELVATYWGTQRLTQDNSGTAVYGGSELFVARGGFEALAGLELPEEARLAVSQVQVYDAAAVECFAGMFASRRNYDVAQGTDAIGRPRCGVLEQSWRVGGASGAELAALEAFRAEPALCTVRAATVEIYGEAAPPPPNATVYFRGVDALDGPMTKYAMVEF